MNINQSSLTSNKFQKSSCVIIVAKVIDCLWKLKSVMCVVFLIEMLAKFPPSKLLSQICVQIGTYGFSKWVLGLFFIFLFLTGLSIYLSMQFAAVFNS